MYSQVAGNKRKSWLLIIIFVLVIGALGFLFAKVYHNTNIVYIAALFALGYAWISYYFSASMVLAVSGAREVAKADAPDLYRVIENLTITAGLPMPKVYIINDSAPNAFATGRDPQHAVVAVTSGILAKLDKSELEGVIAHELSHVGNYDIRFMALVTVMVTVIALLSDWFLRFGFFGRDNEENDNSQFKAILSVVGVVLALLSPLIAMLLQLAVSRKREYLADASGALLSRNPQGLADALAKISADDEPLEAANKATANLYIVNPLRGDGTHGGRSWFANMFSTHPPIAERIARLQKMEGEV